MTAYTFIACSLLAKGYTRIGRSFAHDRPLKVVSQNFCFPHKFFSAVSKSELIVCFKVFLIPSTSCFRFRISLINMQRCSMTSAFTKFKFYGCRTISWQMFGFTAFYNRNSFRRRFFLSCKGLAREALRWFNGLLALWIIHLGCRSCLIPLSIVSSVFRLWTGIGSF